MTSEINHATVDLGNRLINVDNVKDGIAPEVILTAIAEHHSLLKHFEFEIIIRLPVDLLKKLHDL